MKKIEIKKRFPNLRDILKIALKENVLLKTLEGREFIVAEVDDFREEIKRVIQNQDLMEFLDKRSGDTNLIDIDDVHRELSL